MEGGGKAGRAASGETPASLAFAGIKTCRLFGSPWNPQQEQIPLQVSGATGWECFRMDCCDNATAKELPSHKSQCGGLTVSQSSNAQSSHAHARFLRSPLIQLTINDCAAISISAACSRAKSVENEMMMPRRSDEHRCGDTFQVDGHCNRCFRYCSMGLYAG